MEINKTIEMMTSDDFEERFKAEYYQLEIRLNSLAQMLLKYERNELDFKPRCSFDLLNGQLKAMELYKEYLEERAEIENVEIDTTLNSL